MGAVGIEKAAAVRAEVLDELQRGDGALRDCLLRSLQRMCDRIRRKVERHALPNQHQSADERQRQQHPQNGSHQIDPKIAQRFRPLAGKTADEGDAHREPGRAGEKVLGSQADELRGIAQRRFAAIRLPRCRRRETQRRVHRQIERHRRGQIPIVGTAGQHLLKYQQQKQQHGA